MDCSTRPGVGDRIDARGLEHAGIELRFDGARPPHRRSPSSPAGARDHLRPDRGGQGPHRRARSTPGCRCSFEVDGRRARRHRHATARRIHLRHAGEAPRAALRRHRRLRRLPRRLPPGDPDGDGCACCEREYPFAWLGILADVAPCTEELIYAYHDARLLAAQPALAAAQPAVPPGASPTTDIDDWPDERIWEELHARLARDDGWTLHEGPVLEKGVTADAQLRGRADAARAAVPGRRRRAHRAAHRRQGAQPRHRRREVLAEALAALVRARRRVRARRATPRPRCAGSGAPSTSRGG